MSTSEPFPGGTPPSRSGFTLPTMFVIGFPKAGTTTVHRLLTEAGATGATVKEPSVLLVDHGEPGATAAAYHRYFPGHDGASPALDASPYYVYDATAIDRLVTLGTATHVLVAVRSPWARLVSQYVDQASQGFETRTLTEALRDELATPAIHPTARQLSRLYIASSSYRAPLERLLASPLASLVRIVAAERLDDVTTRTAMAEFTGLPVSTDPVRANPARTTTSVAPMLVAKASAKAGSLLPRWVHRRVAPLAKPVLERASTLPIPGRTVVSPDVERDLRAEVEAMLEPGAMWLGELPTSRWLGEPPPWVAG